MGVTSAGSQESVRIGEENDPESDNEQDRVAHHSEDLDKTVDGLLFIWALFLQSPVNPLFLSHALFCFSGALSLLLPLSLSVSPLQSVLSLFC